MRRYRLLCQGSDMSQRQARYRHFSEASMASTMQASCLALGRGVNEQSFLASVQV